MKILVVSQYYYPEPFRINEICEELAVRGHEVTVLTGRPNYPDGVIFPGYENDRFDEIINGVRVIRCKIRPRKTGVLNLFLNYLSFGYKASMAIRKLPRDFDVVYSYQLSPITSSMPACKYAKRNHVPLFLYCLDIWPESVVGNISPKSPVYKYISRLSKKIYATADMIGVSSPSFINYLSELVQWPKERFVYIPQHARDIHNQDYINRDENLNILFTGNIGASQNLDVLLDAVRKIKYHKHIKVTIVGSGSDLERLRKRVERENLSEIVVFEGRQPKEKMPDYYAKADFCFLSLRNEGAVSWTIPGKLQEYMSAGRPILAAINGDAQFVIEDSKCGVWVGSSDSDKLASIILEYLKDKSELIKFGHNARDYYVKHFTLNTHVESLEIELLKLLK